MDARHPPPLGRPINTIEETGGSQQTSVTCHLGIEIVCEEGIGVSDPVAEMSDGISCGGSIEIRLTGPPHHPQSPPEFVESLLCNFMLVMRHLFYLPS
jgi:hypothetical protein